MELVKHSARRILSMLMVALGVTVLSFLLIRVAPGEPAHMIAQARYGDENLTEELVEKVRVEEKLYKPIYEQYFSWLKALIHGDMGESILTGKSVAYEIKSSLPTTIKLSISAMLVSLLLAIPLGAATAAYYGKPTDRIITFGSMLCESMPCFWLALILIICFAVKLHWLPAFGAGSVKHMILPALSLGIGMTAITMRLTRANMLETLSQDYIKTAKGKGLRKSSIVMSHALKNALIPVVTMLGLQFAHLMEGTVVVESIFGLPGMGKLLVDAIFARDYQLIQGCVLSFAFVVVIINIVLEIVYGLIDPRIKTGRRGSND